MSMKDTGEAMQEIGKGVSGCGCLLTLFVTIPIIIMLFIIF